MNTGFFFRWRATNRPSPSLTRTAVKLLSLLLLMLATPVQAQDFTYTTNSGTITITKYTGPGGDVTIPNTINGLPVTGIGGYFITPNLFFSAFRGSTLSSVIIPENVTSIVPLAFFGCTRLAVITVAARNPAYSSVEGVLFTTNQSTIIQCPEGKAGGYTIPKTVTIIGTNAFSACEALTSIAIPDTVAIIGAGAFNHCAGLTAITMPNSVTSIGHLAFASCYNLTGLVFLGNPPRLDSGVLFDGLDSWNDVTVYHLPGIPGWGSTFAGRPTALWSLPNPMILTTGPSFGLQSNQLGFTISWATNISVVVEATAHLTHPAWAPVATNTLTGGASCFSDPAWSKYPARFYRLRSP